MFLKDWIKSLNHAIEGVLHGSKTQKHIRYHFISAFVVLIISYILGLSRIEFLLISLAVILVLLAEMLNSALESVVDMVSPNFSEKARIAKDLAAGAVLITAFGAAVIGYVILFPYLKTFLSQGFRISKHRSEEISLLAFILVLILVIFSKTFIGKGKPLSGGMPSGHSALAFSIWMSITFTSKDFSSSIMCFLLAALIAHSRVESGIHTSLEVIIGGMLGATVTYILFLIFL